MFCGSRILCPSCKLPKWRSGIWFFKMTARVNHVSGRTGKKKAKHLIVWQGRQHIVSSFFSFFDSANSGFYFVRNNAITRFFFSTLLRMGDVMTNDGSHQTVLVSLINEFASWKGLRVKVFPHGVDNPLPGGVEYHREWTRDLFYRMFENNTYPYIFHMSWTFNMDDKLRHYQQMGMWYLGNDTSTCSGLDCCLEEPNFQCHKRDKPSMKPCNDSPMVDAHRGTPFWPKPK